jgi:L-threonylcarbamoyladenylate synthase
MLHLTVDPRHPDPRALARAADIIVCGGVVAYPTDTLYGLAADPRLPSAIDRLRAVKARPAERAIPLIAADLDAVALAGHLTPLAERLAARFWPGPLTLLIPAARDLADGVAGDGGRVGVRVPASEVARALAAAAGGLITATSANRSGEPPTCEPRDLAGLEPWGLDALVDAGPSGGGAPSTIVDASETEPRLVRAGAVPWDRVLEFLERDAGG